MNALRLSLLLLGVVVILLLYLWERLHGRRRISDEEGCGDDAQLEAHLYADMKINPRSGREEEDYASVLADLNPKPPGPDTEADLAASISLVRDGTPGAPTPWPGNSSLPP